MLFEKIEGFVLQDSMLNVWRVIMLRLRPVTASRAIGNRN